MNDCDSSSCSRRTAADRRARPCWRSRRSPAPTTQTLGLHGWQVQSSASAGNNGAALSRPGFAARGWLKVTPDDGGAPGTEVEALVQNGRCPNVFFSTNMKRCFGYMKSLGARHDPALRRAVVVSHDVQRDRTVRSRHATLVVNGVVGEADLWLNGHEVAGHSTLQGAYTQYVFDVTGLAAARRQRARLPAVSQRPEHDVHAGQRRLDPDPARQQHRHPVPRPAAHLRGAGHRRRPRGRAQRARASPARR